MNKAKQNSSRGIFQSKQRRSLKNLYQPNNFYSTTQTLFPSKNNIIKQNQIDNPLLSKAEFYKTLGNSTNWGEWIRPQSKQACRKVMARPQTSKGFRKEPSNNILFTNLQNEMRLENKIKSSLNSKRKSRRIQKQQNYFSNKNNQYDQSGQIQIVINKRTIDNSKKGQSIHKNKFETDLDDQFLELFAD